MRFCGNKENAGETLELNKWNETRLTVAIHRAPQALSSVYEQITDSMCRIISGLCGLTLERAAGAQADIILTAKRIDGSGRTLAYAEVPPDGARSGRFRSTVTMDDSERWGYYDGRLQQAIDGHRVLNHEVFHSLGVLHDPTPAASLMDPSISHIDRPQPWDIRELQIRYGRPTEAPRPEDPGDPPVPHDPTRPTDEELEKVLAWIGGMMLKGVQ